MALNDHDGTGGGGSKQHGTWHGDGLRIRLLHERGETHKHVLKRDYHFQCPPLETLTLQYGATHIDSQTIKAGEFSREGGKNLVIISFSSLFVEWGEFAVRHGQWDPIKNIKKMRDLVHSMSPFRLQIGEFLPKKPEINMLATLRDFQVEHRAGEPTDRYYSVEFHQYRSMELRRKRKGHDDHEHSGGQGSTGTPAVHKLTDADTLHLLARRYYGKPTAAKNIAAANRGLQNWGSGTPIVDHALYTRNDMIQIPSFTSREHAPRITPKVTMDELVDARDESNDELFPHLRDDGSG